MKKKASILKRDNEVTQFLSTGCLLLDEAIIFSTKGKMAGIPCGRITEMSGTGASGKTYICGEICGDALRKGFDTIVVDDIERRWDLDRLNTFGFDEDDPRFNYLVPASSTVEECFERMYGWIDAMKPGERLLIVIDPVAALYSKKEQDGGSDKMGQARAKALQKEMRHLKDHISHTEEDKEVTILFSNQLIDNVGVTMGEKKTTTGGNAMVHWPSIRIRFTKLGDLTRSRKIKGTDVKNTTGIRLKAVIKKNSIDDAFRKVEFSIVFKYGIDNVTDCAKWLYTHTNRLDVLTNKGKIKKKYFKLGDSEPIYTLKKFIHYVEENDLEKKLFALTRIEFKRFHKPVGRKPKQRF